MKIVIKEPTKAYLVDAKESLKSSALEQFLTYTNKSIQFQAQRMAKSVDFYRGSRAAERLEEIDKLKAESKVCLLRKDYSGTWFDAGLAHEVARFLNCEVVSEVEYPLAKGFSWKNPPVVEVRPFQKSSVEKLLIQKHGAVELATGLGKSLIMLLLTQKLGLKTTIMTPSTPISKQLHADFVKHFGSKMIGAFYGGKKESHKQIVIANGQSLIQLEEGCKEWAELSSSEVFIADESHQTPAETFSRVCSGVLSQAPYRFFFSATQIRNDGLDLLLKGITGPIVERMTAKEGIEQGFLADLKFTILGVNSALQYSSSDANAMTRKHLYYNPKVLKAAGDLVNASLSLGKSVLVLIEEVEQFSKLLHFLHNQEPGFAHGPLGENKAKVPKKYWESDTTQLVQDFNDKKFPLLVGTSCISTGTDIRAVEVMIFLKGGKSKIEVLQSVGRCTRKTPTKSRCDIFDFDVLNIDMLRKHTKARESIYNEINSPTRRVVLP